MFSVAAPVFADPVATQIINDIRKDKRRKPVRYSTQLEGVAKAHADEMASLAIRVRMDRPSAVA